LAIWQSQHVRDRLRHIYPNIDVVILGMTTLGDRILDKTLNKIGGKGLFVKELEEALSDGRADIAVHSMKDVPMDLPSGFALAAILEREDPRDALVSNQYRGLAQLPPQSHVGTSSLRRESQIRARFPQLKVEPLRGNVQTRLRKLDEGNYAAIVLAAAGLKRLGLGDRIAHLIEPEQSLPAPGQGAVGIECRADRSDLLELMAVLNHAPTAHCVRAERALSRALGGGCNVPLGGYALIQKDNLWLRGFVASPDGLQFVQGEFSGGFETPEALGSALAAQLRAQGASEILASLGV
jgi:hydroxymethylbilane synthase